MKCKINKHWRTQKRENVPFQRPPFVCANIKALFESDILLACLITIHRFSMQSKWLSTETVSLTILCGFHRTSGHRVSQHLSSASGLSFRVCCMPRANLTRTLALIHSHKLCSDLLWTVVVCKLNHDLATMPPKLP